jgi:hypothetical protein
MNPTALTGTPNSVLMCGQATPCAPSGSATLTNPR